MIFGGNPYNCLTWMDKMGSSMLAGTYGKPSTSRDGAPIELTCLLKHCLSRLILLHEKNIYPYDSVQIGSTSFSFKKWADTISAHFENYYFIPESSRAFEPYDIDPKWVKKKGIYRDVIEGEDPKPSYQLRPNACVGFGLAPELFKPAHALLYLKHLETYLLDKHSIGVKTLQKDAYDFVPYYDNSDEGSDPRIA